MLRVYVKFARYLLFMYGYLEHIYHFLSVMLVDNGMFYRSSKNLYIIVGRDCQGKKLFVTEPN